MRHIACGIAMAHRQPAALPSAAAAAAAAPREAHRALSTRRRALRCTARARGGGRGDWTEQGHLVSEADAQAAAEAGVDSARSQAGMVQDVSQWVEIHGAWRPRGRAKAAHRQGVPNPFGENGWAWAPPGVPKEGLLAGMVLVAALAGAAAVRLLVSAVSARRISKWESILERGGFIRIGELAPVLGAQIADLSSQALGNDGLAFLADVQPSASSRCRVLDLSRNLLGGKSAALLARLLPRLQRLERLALAGNPGLGDEGAALLAKALKPRGFGRRSSQLTALNLSACDIGDPGVLALAAALEDSGCPLTELDLGDNMVDVRGAGALAEALKHNSKLRVLRLEENYVQAEGAAKLADGLKANRALEELYLGSNELGDPGVTALCTGLKQRAAGIQVLDLSNNGFGPAACGALAALLQNCPDIRAIYLRGNSLGNEGIMQIAAALKGKRRLRLVDTSDCDIGRAGAAALAGALQGNKSLRVLQLSSNPLGPEGVEEVVEMVKRPPVTVEILELRACGMGDAAAPVVALFDLLRSSTSLKLLDLRNNTMNQAACEKLKGWRAQQRLAELEAGLSEPFDQCKLLLSPPLDRPQP